MPIIVAFDKSFQSAISNVENINEDQSINWNSVETDIRVELSRIFSDEEINATMEEEFTFAAHEQIEYMESMNYNGVTA